MELNLTVNIKDKPYGIGVGIGGSSDTKWAASSDGGAGIEIGNTSEKANLHGMGKIKAFGNWMNSLSGKIYIASGEGKGLGYDGTVRSDVGAAVAAEMNEQVVANNKGFLGIGGKIRGSLDKEGHAKVDGNINSYTSEELKEIIAAKSSGGRRIKFGFKRTNGNKKSDNKSMEAIEEKLDKVNTHIDNKNGEGCKSDECINDNEHDVSKNGVHDNDEKVASDEDCGEEKTFIKSKVEENTKQQIPDERVDHKHGKEDASDQGNDKEHHRQEVVSDKNTD